MQGKTLNYGLKGNYQLDKNIESYYLLRYNGKIILKVPKVELKPPIKKENKMDNKIDGLYKKQQDLLSEAREQTLDQQLTAQQINDAAKSIIEPAMKKREKMKELSKIKWKSMDNLISHFSAIYERWHDTTSQYFTYMVLATNQGVKPKNAMNDLYFFTLEFSYSGETNRIVEMPVKGVKPNGEIVDWNELINSLVKIPDDKYFDIFNFEQSFQVFKILTRNQGKDFKEIFAKMQALERVEEKFDLLIKLGTASTDNYNFDLSEKD